LRAHLPEIRAELGRIRCAWTPELIEFVDGAITAACRSGEALELANAERQGQVRAAIHRAADRHLTTAFRKFTPRREWAGALWRYLERRHSHFGLLRRPCKRSIREALNEWTPPTGGAQTLRYAAGDNSGGPDGRETDEHHEGQRRRGEGAERAEGR
jgi:acyl-CoA reductase-like NAD-dependent aldehyde dehydrogenase